MMKTTVQLENYTNVKIGGIYKTLFTNTILKEFDQLNIEHYSKVTPIKKGTILTLVEIREHPVWDEWYAVGFLYENRLLWYPILNYFIDEAFNSDFELLY